MATDALPRFIRGHATREMVCAFRPPIFQEPHRLLAREYHKGNDLNVTRVLAGGNIAQVCGMWRRLAVGIKETFVYRPFEAPRNFSATFFVRTEERGREAEVLFTEQDERNI